MSLNFLDFELPIAELEAKIEELQLVNNGQELDLDLEEQITQLREKNNELTQENLLWFRSLANCSCGSSSSTSIYVRLFTTYFH